ncbi:MAG: hypothetical protein AB1938_18205 [Myxococcota bacterium]
MRDPAIAAGLVPMSVYVAYFNTAPSTAFFPNLRPVPVQAGRMVQLTPADLGLQGPGFPRQEVCGDLAFTPTEPWERPRGTTRVPASRGATAAGVMTAPASPSPRSPLAIAEVFYLLGMEDLAHFRFKEADRNLRIARAFAPDHPQVLAALEQLFKAAHQAKVRGATATAVREEDLPPIY